MIRMTWMTACTLALAPLLVSAQAVAPAPVPAPAMAPAPAPPAAPSDTQASNNFSFVSYRADYVVRPDAGNVQTESYDILLKTKAAVEQFSQVRLSYSEKMETLDVVNAYTLTADGQRREVPADRIYTQESYSSAAAAMYADRKVRVVVFPNLAPGTRVVYQTRRASISGVQRRLKIGYNRAARLIEAMEAAGVVSSPEHNGDRTVLAPPPPK